MRPRLHVDSSVSAGWRYFRLTTHITGSKRQSDEGAALFAVRVHVIVSGFITLPNILGIFQLDKQQIYVLSQAPLFLRL